MSTQKTFAEMEGMSDERLHNYLITLSDNEYRDHLSSFEKQRRNRLAVMRSKDEHSGRIPHSRYKRIDAAVARERESIRRDFSLTENQQATILREVEAFADSYKRQWEEARKEAQALTKQGKVTYALNRLNMTYGKWREQLAAIARKRPSASASPSPSPTSYPDDTPPTPTPEKEDDTASVLKSISDIETSLNLLKKKLGITDDDDDVIQAKAFIARARTLCGSKENDQALRTLLQACKNVEKVYVKGGGKLPGQNPMLAKIGKPSVSTWGEWFQNVLPKEQLKTVKPNSAPSTALPITVPTNLTGQDRTKEHFRRQIALLNASNKRQ